MLRATRDAVRRAASSSRATSTRRGMSAGGAAKKPLDGRRQAEEMTAEQIDELSVFNAAGGLAGAAVGGIGVFVIGAAATLGLVTIPEAESHCCGRVWAFVQRLKNL